MMTSSLVFSAKSSGLNPGSSSWIMNLSLDTVTCAWKGKKYLNILVKGPCAGKSRVAIRSSGGRNIQESKLFLFFRASAIQVKEMHELNISISFFPLCSCRGGLASSKIENKDMERKMHFTPPSPLLHTLGGDRIAHGEKKKTCLPDT